LSIRLAILNLFLPVSRAISRIHVPFSHKKIRARHLEAAKLYVKPGAVFVTLVEGELANAFIPGEVSHAAIGSLEKDYVVEAKTSGVTKTHILDFMMTKDRVIILYPAFTNELGMECASEICEMMLGKSYDFFFEQDNKAFYCSELIQFGYRKFDVWTKRKTLGVYTVLPQDFINSAKSTNPKWTIVWDSKNIS
jgi:uncharacterized protein YycO